MKLTDQQIAAFQESVWAYFRDARRIMPWRENPDPYYVLVSELMLQQTQVPRVIPKFESFIRRFPNIQTLTNANLSQILSEWNGLGYNRRAKFLHDSARAVVQNFGGKIPDSYEQLMSLPGVGPNTAGAILTYAFNQPVVFVETNVRTVYIHHFYHDQFDVTDKQIRELAEQTLDGENPREWFWALMDYGTYLKQTRPGRNSQSKHYKKQSPLVGSLREMRGRIIKTLLDTPLGDELLRKRVEADDRFAPAIDALIREGMVAKRNEKWCLTGGDDTR